tara:strand:+ start:769 stop:2355 length:1587 start_codon:yes stop_codon:yes gene_type:complete
MNKFYLNTQTWLLIIIGLFSFFINFHYGNIGVYRIDTFAFFDTAYNILIDRHPFKDIWITTGPLVDYMQSLFFRVFGLNWTSYVIHGSVMNLIISVFFYLTLIKLKLNKYFAFLYSLMFSVLCYTVSATPFAYIHSYVFSLFSLLIFILLLKTNSKTTYFFLPITMLISFFCMQTPATYINVIILFLFLVFISKDFKIKKIKYSLYGLGSILFLFTIMIMSFKIPVLNIFQQYFLFPLTIGEYRVSGNSIAHISFFERLTIRNVLGHFKFINLIILLSLFFTCYGLIKKNKINLKKEDLLINILLILTSLSLIFNQLITSNQTYIFSIIPFFSAFFHIFLIKYFPKNKKIILILLVLVIFTSGKYHLEYNEKRKFMDLQNVNLKNSIKGDLLDKKLKGLKWITPEFSKNPEEEIKLISEALQHIKNQKKEKMVITQYQFFSILLEENLNIPNRWYTPDNNSYPRENHKYFQFYLDHLVENINNNNIGVIYIVDNDLSIKYLPMAKANLCYDTENINKITKVYKLKKCN